MITYNDLYELLRKEKYSETLQVLPKNFLADFSDFLHDSKNDSQESDLFQEHIAKAKKQLENAISLFKELMLRRKKKLLSLVFIAAETGIMKRDYENMVDIEREVFDILVKTFEDADKKVFNLVNGKKGQADSVNKMIIFNQEVEQFVDMFGNVVGPFHVGELANLDGPVCEILVGGGKARFVDER